MRKFLLLPLVLLLAACQPAAAESTPVETSGGVVAVDPLIAEITETLESVMIEGWPYFREWETCIINGETYNNVTFMYTDLGLGYMVDDILYYRLEMEVTECKTVILRTNDTE